ncbi:MAG: hypothetical protein KJ888_20270 [Gammaproteobacteria bacterium]|nr:hypothetical protein [Gammaproteobacteria bacterium]
MKTKEEKWDELCKSMGWLGNPSVEIVLLDIYASQQGNHEKYLKLKKLKEKIKTFFDQEADENAFTDYVQCYEMLGIIKGILFDEPMTVVDKQ